MLSEACRQALNEMRVPQYVKGMACSRCGASATSTNHPLDLQMKEAKSLFDKRLVAYKRRDRRQDKGLMDRALRNPGVAKAAQDVKVLEFKIKFVCPVCNLNFGTVDVDYQEDMYKRWRNRCQEVLGVDKVGFRQGSLAPSVAEFQNYDPSISDESLVRKMFGLSDSVAARLTRIFQEEDSRQSKLTTLNESRACALSV